MVTIAMDSLNRVKDKFSIEKLLNQLPEIYLKFLKAAQKVEGWNSTNKSI